MPQGAILQPIVDKLDRLSSLSESERTAILGLPCHEASIERGDYLVREGDRRTHVARSCPASSTGRRLPGKVPVKSSPCI